MSRGFRDADATVEQTARAAAEAIAKVREADVVQEGRAAERRAAGRYGFCEDCNRPIDPVRLEVLPNSTRCVSCQAERDRQLPPSPSL